MQSFTDWNTRNNWKGNAWSNPTNPAYGSSCNTSPYQPGYTINLPPNYNPPPKTMGTNTFNVGLKNSFRWTLELQYHGQTLAGPVVVKVAARPKVEIEETELDFLSDKTWIPGRTVWEELAVTAYIDSSTANNPGRGEHNLVHQADELAHAQGLTGVLRLWDGNGGQLENWELKDLFCKSYDLDLQYGGDVLLEMKFRYSSVHYTSMMPAWAVPGELAASKRQAIIDKARAYAPHLRFTEF